MNTKRRFLYGLVSSFLLTCGFAKAAERFDPLHHLSDIASVSGIAPDCSNPCEVWPPA